VRTSGPYALIAAVLLISAVCSSVRGQEGECLPAGGCKMLSDKGTVTIPFELELNHLFVRAKINDQESLRLCLDTGMPTHGAVLFGTAKVKRLGLPSAGQAMCAGPGGAPVPADLATGVDLLIPGLELTGQTVLVMPHNPYQDRLEMDGVIGYSLFSRFAVKIDFDNRLITLTEPERFEYWGTGQELPLALSGNFPLVSCEARTSGGAKIPVQLVVDLGAGHALSLNVHSQEDIIVPQGAIEFRLGTGVGGDVNGQIGRISSLRLGQFTLDHVVTSFADASLRGCGVSGTAQHGNLGTDALRRFNVTFDYPNQRMILEPNNHFKDPFEFNMAGIGFKRTDQGTFGVDRVIRNSPAGESGLKKDDVVDRVNGRPASDFSEEDLEELLREEGREVSLGISRGGEQIEVRLKLRRLI
jgi:hypothetical protein